MITCRLVFNTTFTMICLNIYQQAVFNKYCTVSKRAICSILGFFLIWFWFYFMYITPAFLVSGIYCIINCVHLNRALHLSITPAVLGFTRLLIRSCTPKPHTVTAWCTQQRVVFCSYPFRCWCTTNRLGMFHSSHRAMNSTDNAAVLSLASAPNLIELDLSAVWRCYCSRMALIKLLVVVNCSICLSQLFFIIST